MSEAARVLAIEDDNVDQMALRRLFSEKDTLGVLTIAGSAAEARKMLIGTEFEVVLLDYQLGNETGLSLLEAIGDIPVIFISGMSNVEIAVQAMKAGAFDFLLKDTEGNYLEVLPIVLDNALRRRRAEDALFEAQEQLKMLEAEKMRAAWITQMVQDISHDVRTPLTILQNSIYIIQNLSAQLYAIAVRESRTDSLESLAKLQLHSGYLMKHLVRLREMLLKMLDMSRLENMPELHRETLDLNAICRDVAGSFKLVAEARGIQLITNLAQDALWIKADRYELISAVTNLMDNALNYSSPGTPIILYTYRRVQHAILEVIDKGIGIQAEDLPHIFERFYRSDKARSTKTGGFGLGLAKVKRITELHQGFIEVESQIDEGSTFRLGIPLESTPV